MPLARGLRCQSHVSVNTSQFCSPQAFDFHRAVFPELAPSHPHLTFTTFSVQLEDELWFLQFWSPLSPSHQHQAQISPPRLCGVGQERDE